MVIAMIGIGLNHLIIVHQKCCLTVDFQSKWIIIYRKVLLAALGSGREVYLYLLLMALAVLDWLLGIILGLCCRFCVAIEYLRHSCRESVAFQIW